ncbi:MAG: hypothetical protein WCD87_20090, partial [Pseudolabrys sp.]
EAGDVVRSLRFTGVINFLECALGLFECADTPRAVYLLGLRVEGSRRRHADESYGKIASPHFLLPRFAPPIVSDW